MYQVGLFGLLLTVSLSVGVAWLIISAEGGIDRSHSHLYDMLICTDLLEIVFPGANPNPLNGFGSSPWPRV